jgi:hypothetical protein
MKGGVMDIEEEVKEMQMVIEEIGGNSLSKSEASKGKNEVNSINSDSNGK